MTFTIGIDLGTTNSSAAAYRPGAGPVVIETLDGASYMPSAVSFDRTGKILTGRAAVRNMADSPEFTFFNMKQELGRVVGENHEYTEQQRRGEGGVTVWQGPDNTYKSEELLSHVVKTLLIAAEYKFGDTPTGVVATVPVGFHDPERRAVRSAIELAGIPAENIHLLEEPIAAAMSFALNDEDYRRNVVYDFGGGTFDFTVIRSRGGVHKPVDAGGSRMIGGVQIDSIIAEQCIDAFMEDRGHDLREMPYVMVPLLKSAEDAKIALSYNNEAQIFLPNILSFPDDNLADIEFDLTVEDLEVMAGDLIDATLDICREILESVDYKPSQIDNVIMIGGQTRMPLVQKKVEAFFGRKPIFDSPEVAVAKGAAIYAAEKDGMIAPTLIQKILTASVGVRHANGNFVEVLKKGETLPCEREVLIRKAHDPQEKFQVDLRQGESRACDLNTLIVLTDHATDEERIPVRISADEAGAISLEVDGEMKYGGET